MICLSVYVKFNYFQNCWMDLYRTVLDLLGHLTARNGKSLVQIRWLWLWFSDMEFNQVQFHLT